MTRFKNRSGFTLIEVLIALAIISLSILPIYTIQSTLLSIVTRRSESCLRMLHAQNFLQEIRLALRADQKDVAKQKKITDPAITLRYEQTPIANDSALAKVKKIKLEKVIIEWQDGKNKRQDQLVSVVYEQERGNKS